MDAPYLHSVVTHVPVVLAVVGTLAALLALGLRKRGLWVYAAASLTLAGATIYPVHLTGGAAAGAVERRPSASPAAVGAHAQAAELATWVTLAAGVLAAYAWFRAARPRHREDRFPPALQVLLTLSGLAASGALGYAAWQSGFIAHRVSSPAVAPGTHTLPATPLPPAAPAP